MCMLRFQALSPDMWPAPLSCAPRVLINMAATSTWRSALNSHQFCKQLKENNAKDSQKKLTLDAKRLIVTTHDGDLFVWDSYSAHMVFFRLKNLLPESKEKVKRFQTLFCTDAPRFEVEGLCLNQSASHIIIWGHTGVKVIELPQRYGKYGEFGGGKQTVSCRTIPIAERYFTSQQGIKLQHVAWHPGSSSDSHVVLLTSDNVLSIYDIGDPEKPIKTIDLEGNGRFEFSASPTKLKLSSALGETAVSFDFGPPTELKPRQHLGLANIQEPLPVWPVYVVKGNGDVMVVYTSIRFTRMPLPVLGPLVMCPPADDNYGLDACAIHCLNVTPPVVVIAAGEGKLHHCIVMQGDDGDDLSIMSEPMQSAPNQSIYEAVSEPKLYVYESVELELSLTPTGVEDDQIPEDDINCPISLTRDPCINTRYHCCHGAGVHSVLLPWVNSVQRFLSDEKNESSLGQSQESIVEHVICTRPLPNSPPAPILGLDIVSDPTLTPTLLTLTSDLDFVALPLSTKRSVSQLKSTLLLESPGPGVASPLRHLMKDDNFDDYIAKILLRSSSHPVLKSNPRTDLTQQECFQLLSRATQVFREEYIQKQDQARQSIEARVRILQAQKEQQQDDLQTLNQSKNILQDQAEELSTKINQAQENQETLLKRLEQILRKIQSRVPMLSDAEKHMQKELAMMKVNLNNFSKKLEQVRVKQDYQQKQVSRESRSSGSPAIQKNQMGQLRDILSQEGEEIAGLIKLLTQIKMETNS